MELQVLPAPAGRADDPYAHVDASIALIAASGATEDELVEEFEQARREARKHKQ